MTKTCSSCGKPLDPEAGRPLPAGRCPACNSLLIDRDAAAGLRRELPGPVVPAGRSDQVGELPGLRRPLRRDGSVVGNTKSPAVWKWMLGSGVSLLFLVSLGSEAIATTVLLPCLGVVLVVFAAMMVAEARSPTSDIRDEEQERGRGIGAESPATNYEPADGALVREPPPEAIKR